MLPVEHAVPREVVDQRLVVLQQLGGEHLVPGGDHVEDFELARVVATKAVDHLLEDAAAPLGETLQHLLGVFEVGPQRAFRELGDEVGGGEARQ